MQNRIRSLIIRNHQKPNCIEPLNSPVPLTVVPELSRGDALLSQQRGGQCRVAASESIGVQWQPFTNLQTRRRVRFSKHSNRYSEFLSHFEVQGKNACSTIVVWHSIFYIYQPPANAAGLCWAWDCKQHGQKHHQKQQQQQQHHSLHCQQHGEKHHQKQQQQQQQPTAAITTGATTTTTTATTTTTTTTTPAATTTTATTTTTTTTRTTTTRTRTRTTATATATRAAAAAATAGSQQLTANSQQEQQHRRGPRGNRARDLLDVGWSWWSWWSWCLCLWWWWGGAGGVILGEVKARPKDIISFSLDYISKSKVQTSNPSSSPTPLDTPARPAD